MNQNTVLAAPDPKIDQGCKNNPNNPQNRSFFQVQHIFSITPSLCSKYDRL